MKGITQMKKIVLIMIALGLWTGPAFSFAAPKKAEKPAAKAEGKKPGAKKPGEKKPKKPAPELSDITVSGKVAKKETKGKDGKTYKYYSVSTSDGKTVRLTKSALGKKSKVNLDELVDAEVKVTGKGYEAGKGKKKRIILKKIEKVEKSGDAG